MQTPTRGFTLIELLIVIAIILILIAIALPNFLEAQIRAKVVKAAGDTRTIATALESYFTQMGTYPYDGPFAYLQMTSPIPYLKEIPRNPFGEHINQGGSIIDEVYPIGTGILAKTELKCCRPSYPAGFNRENPPFKEAYIVYSAGPSDDEPGEPTGTFPTEAIAPYWTVYAPTNGTKSFGGVIVTGGVTLQHPSAVVHQHLSMLSHLTHL